MIGGIAFAADDSKVAFTFDGPRSNTDVYVRDLLRGNSTARLTHSSRAGLDFSRFSEPQLVEYKSFDGRMIPAWFYPAPAAAGDLPPVIDPSLHAFTVEHVRPGRVQDAGHLAEGHFAAGGRVQQRRPDGCRVAP